MARPPIIHRLTSTHTSLDDGIEETTPSGEVSTNPEAVALPPIDNVLSKIPTISEKDRERNPGLGWKHGGELTRSLLSWAGTAPTVEVMTLSPTALMRRGYHVLGPGDTTKIVSRDATLGRLDSQSDPLGASETEKMIMSLIMNDVSPVLERDLRTVACHRWTFNGARELAATGRGMYCLVRCLLELQRNVQLAVEDPLEPQLLRSCRVFVRGQCRAGHSDQMYRLICNVISNSVLFNEWANFVKITFKHSKALESAFLDVYLEQVWTRFTRLTLALHNLFSLLDDSYAKKCRLPSVHDLLRDHMRRRCFPDAVCLKNDAFNRENCGDIVKEIRRVCSCKGV